jgi:hypothetical protein
MKTLVWVYVALNAAFFVVVAFVLWAKLSS